MGKSKHIARATAVSPDTSGRGRERDECNENDARDERERRPGDALREDGEGPTSYLTTEAAQPDPDASKVHGLAHTRSSHSLGTRSASTRSTKSTHKVANTRRRRAAGRRALPSTVPEHVEIEVTVPEPAEVAVGQYHAVAPLSRAGTVSRAAERTVGKIKSPSLRAEREINRLINKPFLGDKEDSVLEDAGVHKGEDRFLASFARLFRGRSDKEDRDRLPEMIFV